MSRHQKKRFWNASSIVLIILFIVILTVRFTTGKIDTGQTIQTTIDFAHEGTKMSSDTIRLMTYNIHYGYGYTNADKTPEEIYGFLDDIADTIRDADIVTLQEADVSARRTHYIDEVQYLAEKAGFQYAAFADNWNFKIFPWLSPVHFGKYRTGHAILSRYPIKDHQAEFFRKENSPVNLLYFLRRTQQRAKIDVGSTVLDLFNVHLESESNIDRMDQARQLVDMVKDTKKPIILLGDFNALMPEASDKDFPGENYDGDDAIRIIRSAGLDGVLPPDNYTKDEERYFTFPSRKPNRRLDYAFTTDDIHVISARTLSSEKIVEASDHLPTEIIISLS